MQSRAILIGALIVLVACAGKDPLPVALRISPTSPAIGVRQTESLRAIGSFADGSSVSQLNVNWSSADTSVAIVNAYGTVVGVRAGTTFVRAEQKARRDSVRITVSDNSEKNAVGPLRVSKDNPRYFADPQGRAVYLTGSHYWKNVQDDDVHDPPKPFDNRAYLDFLTSHNHNFTRLWVWEQARWSDEVSYSHWIAPTIYVRSGPGSAADGGPKFDLTRLNPDFFSRLRQRVIDAGARGIYVSVMLFDGWSLEMKPGNAKANPWRAHPFNALNNINGVNGDKNGDQSGREVETLSNPAITALQEKYVMAVVDAVNDQDNVLYEISNESDSSGVAWQYHMVNFVRSYEARKPKQHPIGMTATWPGTNKALLDGPADWVSMNGSPEEPPVAAGTKVSLSDTDHLCGICGSVSWVWKSFLRGHNPILMDGYDNSPGVSDPAYDPRDSKWEAIRRNLGYARIYAERMDLSRARPCGELVSTSYCLAVPGRQYVVLLPEGRTATLDLSSVRGVKKIEWFDPATGRTRAGDGAKGGGKVDLRSPFGPPSVAYIAD